MRINRILCLVVGLAFANGALSLIAERAHSQERAASSRVNDSIVYHGKLVNPSGQAVSGTVQVRIKIFSPEPSLCLLWSEQQTVTARNGGFSMELGYADHRVAGTSGGVASDFRSVFINNPGITHTGGTCVAGSSYTPSGNDDRLMTAEFVENGVSVTVEKIPIKSVPFAKQASEIAGFGIGNLFKISGAGSSEQFTPDEVSRLKSLSGGGNANQVLGISNAGNSIEYKSITAGSGISIAHTAGGIQISATGGGGGGLTGTDVISALGYTPQAQLGFTPISSTSSSEVIAALGYTPQAQLGFTPQAELGYTPVNKSGDTMTGALSLPANGLSVGSNQFVLSGGSVGIGTASPTAALTLNYSANGSGLHINNDSTSTSSVAGIQLHPANGGWGYINVGDPGNTTVDSANRLSMFAQTTLNGISLTSHAAGGDIRMYTGGRTNERLRIQSGGNVGIGTPSPGAKLEVAGQIKITGGSPGAGKVLTSDASGLASWTTPSGSVSNVAVGGLPLSVVNGSSTPTISIAQANGSQAGFLSSSDWTLFNSKQPAGAYLTGITGAQVTSALGFTPISNTSSAEVIAALGYTPQSVIGFTPVSNALPANQTFIGNGSNVAAAGFFGVGNLRNSSGTAQFPSSCAASQTLTWSAVTDVFNCTNIGSLPASAISSGTIDNARLPFGASLWQDGASGRIYYSGGNVGIGTSSPTYPLDVSGQIRSTTTVSAPYFSSPAGHLYLQPFSGAIVGYGNGLTYQMQLFNGATANVQIHSNGSSFFNGGNVGIGTTSPASALQVAGDITPSSDYAATPIRNLGSASLRYGAVFASTFTNGVSTVALTSSGNGVIINPATNTIFQTNGTERVRIDGSGNVGIGTTTPGEKLSVGINAIVAHDGGAKTIGFNTDYDGVSGWDVQPGGAYQAGIEFTPANGNLAIGISNVNDSNFTGAHNSMTIKSSGNVGIGTTSPGANTKLEVAGQIKAGSTTISTGSVNFSAGNTVMTSFDCGSAISFANLRDGGSYTLVVSGTGTSQCTFDTTTTGDDAATVTYRYKPANAVRTASSYTIYSLFRVGTVVFVGWSTGW